MQILTRNEANHRAAHLNVSAIDVIVDLRAAANTQVSTYPVTSRLTMSSLEERTFIDIVGQVTDVLVNGTSHDFEDDEDRVWVGDLPVGEPFTLEVRALASFSRSGEGLHRYVDPEDGEVYLYTQFEPNDAHRAWPCIDQPDVKPEWTFHVIAPREWVVSSNGVEVSCEPIQGEALRHNFSATRPLSSYITAIVAGPWAIIDGGTWSGGASDGGHAQLALRLLCRRTLARYLDSDDVFEVTRAGLDFFHERYGVTFPWGSYDQVYVPEYNLGAMENPGCITFNESYISRSTPTFTERQRRANTTLHEMCHMWFGDLATPAWWDDLWLKESFAENQGASASAIATATRYAGEWANFAMNRKIWAYAQDQMPTTHPIAADIPDVAAAKTNFDGITYAKGAAVLKQLVAWVGEDAFYEGTRRYFAAHQFGATRLGDLLQALEEASGQKLESWKEAWLETSGPSTLYATWSADTVGAMSDFTLHQGSNSCAGVLRPHRVNVSTWRVAGGALERTHVFDVRIEAESSPIDPDGALAVPGGVALADLVVINDDDLTYAISRLDEHSTDVALAYVATIDSALTRAVVWASLWNAVRDAELDPRRFITAALGAVGAESEPAIRDRLLLFVSEALSSFLPGSARASVHDEVAATLIRLSKDSEDLDARRSYTRAFIAEFSARGGAQYEVFVTELAHSDDPDLAWRARRALAARGLTDEAQIEQWRAEDGSGEAARMSVEARASLPSHEARKRAWDAVFADSLSNDFLSATLAGLQASSWEGESGIERAVEGMRAYWESHTIGMALRYANGVLALGLDVSREGSVEGTVGLLHSWLDANEDAPAQLRRIAIEHLDAFERNERAQRRWERDQ